MAADMRRISTIMVTAIMSRFVFVFWIVSCSQVPNNYVTQLNSTQLKNGLFDIIVQDNNDVMTTINARY